MYNGQLPYGFDRDGDDMIKNASEQAVIADIVTRRNEGATLTSIADELNERGLQGKAGGKWYASTVKNVITYQKTL